MMQHNPLPPIHPYSPFEVIQLSRNRVTATPIGHASVQLPQDVSCPQPFFPCIEEHSIVQSEKERVDFIQTKMDSIKALNSALLAEKETSQTPPTLIPKYSRRIFDPEAFQAQLMKPLKALQKVTFEKDSKASGNPDKARVNERVESSVIYAWDQWNQSKSMQKRLASRVEISSKDTLKDSVPIQPVSLIRGESEVGFPFFRAKSLDADSRK